MTSESSGSRLPILFRSSRILAYAALLSAIISAAFLYRNAIGSLFLAWQRPEYSHGYFIPFLALLIGLKRHVSGFGEGSEVSWAGLGTMLVAIFFGIFGNLAGINDIAAYGLILCVAGLLIVTTGWKAAVRLWPAVIYLGFMLPLPNSIYWPLSIKLQFLSSKIGVAIIGLMGIPVYLEGNIIDLGTYQLQVAEACSGLRYLFPLMSFGFLVATLYRGPSWQKVLLFLATIPITIFMNSGRIGVIGYLVNSYGIAQAEGFLHLFEGWVVFALCILLLLAIAAALSRKFAVADFLDLEFDGFSKRFTLLTDVPFRNGIIVSAVLLALAAVVSPALFKQVSIHPQRTALDHFPMDISGWHGTRQFLSFDVERVLNADDYLLADFSGPVGSKVPVNLLI